MPANEQNTQQTKATTITADKPHFPVHASTSNAQLATGIEVQCGQSALIKNAMPVSPNGVMQLILNNGDHDNTSVTSKKQHPTTSE
jgi:hypothetical protein